MNKLFHCFDEKICTICKTKTKTDVEQNSDVTVT